jgi:hypothetical protein
MPSMAKEIAGVSVIFRLKDALVTSLI